MSDRLRKVQRIYDQDPDAYHRAMSTRFSDWLTGGRRRKVGETVRGLVLDVGFGTGLSIPHYPPDVRVVGIDLSSKMLEVGRRFARERSRQADVGAYARFRIQGRRSEKPCESPSQGRPWCSSSMSGAT